MIEVTQGERLLGNILTASMVTWQKEREKHYKPKTLSRFKELGYYDWDCRRLNFMVTKETVSSLLWETWRYCKVYEFIQWGNIRVTKLWDTGRKRKGANRILRVDIRTFYSPKRTTASFIVHLNPELE